MKVGTILARGFCALAVAAIAYTSLSGAAVAQGFFKGKTMTILIGSRAGGSYDAYARLMARHMGRYLPGIPVIVPKNMPGAAGTRTANYLYNVAPKDGTYMGATLNTIPLTKIMRPKRAQYDVSKFNWIGTTASPPNVLVVWHTAGVKTLEDAKRKSVVIGATTAGSTQDMYPLMANRMFGTKFKVVLGYRGGKGVNLAMERGEVQGRGSNSWISYNFQNPAWIKEKRIIPLFQMTLTRDPDLKHVPSLIEFAKNNEQRQIISLLANTEKIGRSVMAPPDLPTDRVRMLRSAFAKALKDPKLLADANRAKLVIKPVLGEELQKMVSNITNTPSDIIEKFKSVVRPDKNASRDKDKKKKEK